VGEAVASRAHTHPHTHTPVTERHFRVIAAACMPHLSRIVTPSGAPSTAFMASLQAMLVSVRKKLAEELGRDLEWRIATQKGAALLSGYLLPLGGDIFSDQELMDAFITQHNVPEAQARELAKRLRDVYASPLSLQPVWDLCPEPDETMAEVRSWGGGGGGVTFALSVLHTVNRTCCRPSFFPRVSPSSRSQCERHCRRSTPSSCGSLRQALKDTRNIW